MRIWIGWICVILGLIILSGGNATGAAACFKTREKSVGAVKVCFYDCAREQTSIIIHGGETCPLTIEGGEE